MEAVCTDTQNRLPGTMYRHPQKKCQELFCYCTNEWKIQRPLKGSQTLRHGSVPERIKHDFNGCHGVQNSRHNDEYIAATQFIPDDCRETLSRLTIGGRCYKFQRMRAHSAGLNNTTACWLRDAANRIEVAAYIGGCCSLISFGAQATLLPNRERLSVYPDLTLEKSRVSLPAQSTWTTKMLSRGANHESQKVS